MSEQDKEMEAKMREVLMDKIDHSIGYLALDWLQWGDEWDDERAQISLKYMSQLKTAVKSQCAEIQSLQSKLATAVEALDKIANTQDVVPRDAEYSGPCRISLAETRNRRILEARDALALIKGAAK
jgi:hypothetical protein